MALADFDTLAATHAKALAPNRRRQAAWLGGLLLLALYTVYVWNAFDVSTALGRANTDRAELLALDSYAHKIHVEMSLKDPAALEVELEGNRRNTYETLPEWITPAASGWDVEMNAGYDIALRPDGLRMTDRHGALIADIAFRPEGPVLLSAPQPWLKVAPNKIEGRPDSYARFIVTRSKVTLMNYFTGWENFWFDWNSPLRGVGFTGALALIASEDRVDPGQSNLSLVVSEFLGNQDWQHGEIFEALGITVLMAVVGTLMAAFCALPLAFIAANNITPSAWLRGPFKRLFDFLRGVDALIWSLIFIRAFGLGPLSGILAIWFTDTGTFGKLFSEAIENADRRQVEGMQSTGASPIQRTWFGIMPQILPVFISQSLYFLESNTRSATVIGMLGAGGIGLKLADTMRTGQDWENTMYIIVLIIGIVIVMDNVSSRLRRRLIDGSK
ncbi:phosphonate ABC transporter, permease protein PhnE [Paroceanicella profunda]|uniref:Phosphonate ABC transporter, permease protein PhnE n=1 Tax=Paroceanicella profunda TaxID=2579971 RepID=A0A5B8FH05_9RHOB|nr:phosphonate ABC transporter, permease protein PhnE [Paroceanicella profunda]QDL91861.1 phosphonate ABC transporter, permease protein PhnE [Paroceanicella profunda]